VYTGLQDDFQALEESPKTSDRLVQQEEYANLKSLNAI
jgi:hypothetical protein